MGSPCTTLEFRQKINTANIAPTSGTEYSSALGIMDILQNFHQSLRSSGWKIGEYFFKTKWPHYAVNNYIYYTKHKSPEQFLLQIKITVSELFFIMTEIIQLYHLSHTPILYGLENDSQNASLFSISDDYNVTSIHDKA